MPDITDGMNELEFLASKAAAGKLIIKTGTKTGSGVVCTYTVPSGSTFILYRAHATLHNEAVGVANVCTATLRNNGTIVDQIYSLIATAVGLISNTTEFVIRGDQLIGDGSKAYDINFTQGNANDTCFATFIGYLL